MGDIESVTGVHLIQLENRQLKIEKCNKKKLEGFFICFYCWVICQKKYNLDFLRTFDPFSILYDLN